MSSALNFLLTGKTGNGKSATGNSILDRKVFESKFSATPVTKTVDYEVGSFLDHVITVVDTPGLMDNSDVYIVMNNMEHATLLNPSGYDGFILVLKFGQRFTGEDTEVINLLKKIWGEDFVKRFVFIVFTGGDDFENETEKTGKSFRDWCHEQNGELKTLLKECSFRAALFNNLTENRDKKQKQLGELIKMVKKLPYGQRYTAENFARARKAREECLIEIKTPLIRDSLLQELSCILQSLQQILFCGNESEMLIQLDALLFRTDKLSEDIRNKYKFPESLQDLLKVIKLLEKNILLARRNTYERKATSLVYQTSLEKLTDLQLNLSDEIESWKEIHELHWTEWNYGDQFMVDVTKEDQQENKLTTNEGMTEVRKQKGNAEVGERKGRSKEKEELKKQKAQDKKQREKIKKLEKMFQVFKDKINGTILTEVKGRETGLFKDIFTLLKK